MSDRAAAYTMAVENGVAIARFVRQPSAQDINDATYEFAQLTKNNLRLWDLSVGINLSERDVQETAAYATSLKFPPSRIAILVNNGLSFGIARMHERYRRQDTQEYLVVESEKEAMDWLLSEDPRK